MHNSLKKSCIVYWLLDEMAINVLIKSTITVLMYVVLGHLASTQVQISSNQQNGSKTGELLALMLLFQLYRMYEIILSCCLAWIQYLPLTQFPPNSAPQRLCHPQ